MLALEESLRALYFAPVPLVVLTNNRTIKMLNRSAELVFGITSARCIGQRLERYLEPTSQGPYATSINESMKMAIESSPGMARPVSTRLQLLQNDTQTIPVWAEFTISTWFPTDPVTGPSPASSSGQHSSSSPADSLVGSLRYPHESLYTISVTPSTKADTQLSALVQGNEDTTLALKQAFFEELDLPIIALSKDGKTEIRNQACVDLFASFQKTSVEQMHVDTIQEEDILPWAKTTLSFYDENFEMPFPDTQWPIHNCALLGQTTPPVLVGCECKATNMRQVLEFRPKALRNQGGFGEHIGGYCSIKNVTAERKQWRQESEAQSELQLRQTVDTMPQLIWQANSAGYCDWYSTSFYQYTGMTYQQLEGTGWSECIHPDDLAVAFKGWSESLRTGATLDCTFRIRRHDGVQRWFLCRAACRRDAVTGEIVKWSGCNTDVHDQVEALSLSQQTQAQLQSVINHAAVTLWAVDLQGIITVAEGPGIRQLKFASPSSGSSSSNRKSDEKNKDSVIGRSIYELWDLTNIRDLMSKALEGETAVSEMELGGRWFRTSYTPLRKQEKDSQILANGSFNEWKTEEEEIVGVVGVSMDITERKEAQERMEESTLEKTRALAAEGAAREASRLKSQFLANMSHEIRTPIAGIIGLSELLLDEKGLTSKHREYAETIERSAEGLLTVINDVLDFSKVEIGKLDVEQIPFNLVVLLGDLKRMLSFATQKKGLEFNESVNLVHKDNLIGDLGRLRQVLTNLLTNAIKFTSQGHISLEVAEEMESATEVVVRFDIKDTGCGIHSDALLLLFQPFSQADASTARRFGGTGLGLSISKNLVELMGGEIGLTSIEGKGSHAWFTIPFRKATSIELPSQKRKLDETMSDSSLGLGSGGMPIAETTSLSRPRKDIWILVAEDNAVNARIALKNIEKMGFSCSIAENGLVALKELDRRRYDAVLMDCQMPDCDGYEATRRIRRSSNVEIRTLPVIALTASAIIGDRERAIDAGMVDYLAKPVKRNALESTLCKWLYDYSARQNLATFI